MNDPEEQGMVPFAMSDSINEIAGALAKAQAHIQDPAKNAENPFYNSNYTDLAGVLSVIRPAFSEYGLALVQLPFVQEDGFSIERVPKERGDDDILIRATGAVATMVTHESGQWISTFVHCPVLGKNPAQELGKVITYLRRYSAAAVAAIAQVDDDGNDERQRMGQQSRVDVPPEPLASIPEIKRIAQLVDQSKADLDAFLAHFKTESIDKLPRRRVQDAINMLEAKIRKNERDAAQAVHQAVEDENQDQTTDPDEQPQPQG